MSLKIGYSDSKEVRDELSIPADRLLTTEPQIDPSPRFSFALDVTDDGVPIEVMESRGQTYRHFRYSNSVSKYLYQSDILVQKTGIVEGSNWVTLDEYPIEFIIRLINGTVFSFNSSKGVELFVSELNHSQLWGVGLETYAGVMGFYLDIADQSNGHGQYLYWPRLLDGTITSYELPLYNIYTHLYAKRKNSDWVNQLLNDQSLYTSSNQDPRNQLAFFVSDTQMGIQYTASNVRIQGSRWDFTHGFKFDLSDGLFHMITTLECHNQNFDDIGLTYDILTSPEATDSLHQLESVQLTNKTHSLNAETTQAWQADTYLNNYSSNIEVVSQNNNSFCFAFDDMREAGFTEKSLLLTDQRLPDGSIRKTLQAGMSNYGSYIAGEKIVIDPVLATKYVTDNYDLYLTGSSYSTGSTALMAGVAGGSPYNKKAFIAFDTGLEYEIDTSIIDNSFQIRYSSTDDFESGEGISLSVYNIVGSGNGADSNTAKEDSQSYSLGTNSGEDLVWEDGLGSGYQSGDWTKVDNLLEYWAEHRGTGENYISFMLEGYAVDQFTHDDAHFFDSQYNGNSHAPKLSFSYNWEYPTDLTITSTSVTGNPEKGENVPFSITIANNGDIAATEVKVKILIKGDDYDWSDFIGDWVTWDTNLPGWATETHTITSNNIFEYESKVYAWNAGNYTIDQVSTKSVGGAGDTNLTDVDFDVDQNSEYVEPAIFLHLVYDTEFLANIASNNVKNYTQDLDGLKEFYEDDIIEGEFLINVNNDTGTRGNAYSFDSYFVHLIPYYGTWNPSASADWGNTLEQAAENNLGMTNWDRGDQWEGQTKAANHGFDLLTGLTGVNGSAGAAPGNTNYVRWNGPWVGTFNLNWTYVLVLHELIHNFKIDDARAEVWDGTGIPFINKGDPDFDKGYIMSGIQEGMDPDADPQINYWQNDGLWPIHLITLYFLDTSCYGGL
ncbi:MAG: CARDB domain-containing protein [Candidatus Hodarchaeales archaeon]